MLAPKVEMLAPMAVSLSTTYLGGKCLYVGTNAGSVIVRIFEDLLWQKTTEEEVLHSSMMIK